MPENDPIPVVVLDRDGVINFDSDDYIKSIDEWMPIPGSIQAIAKLSRAGFRIFIATNQSGIGRGYYDEYTLGHMHQLLNELVENAGGHIDAIFYCPHTPAENCSCRKPATGLLDQLESQFMLNLSGGWYVGDAEKDIDLAFAKGLDPILVRTGKGERTLNSLSPEKIARIVVTENLATAAELILQSDQAHQENHQ